MGGHFILYTSVFLKLLVELLDSNIMTTTHPTCNFCYCLSGFAFAAAAVITAQVSMVGSASMTGWMVPKVGTKPLFLFALLAIPVRGILIVLVLQSNTEAKNVFLLATQVLDGLAGGIIGVLLVLITENLSR